MFHRFGGATDSQCFSVSVSVQYIAVILKISLSIEGYLVTKSQGRELTQHYQ